MNFATKQRLLLGIAVLLMFTPTILYSAGLLGRAPLYEGDVRKEMTCLTCGGFGIVDEEKCDTCRGRGVAEYIVPGPNRPLQLVGTVYGPSGETIKGAEIAVREGGDAAGQEESLELLYVTNDDGQFGVKLPPGEYVIKAQAEGNGVAEEQVVVTQVADPLPATKLETLHRLEKEFRLQ